MGLNHRAIFAKIEELTSSELPVNARMKEIISLCATDVPHASWPQFATLDYDRDIASLSAWIPEAFERKPALFPVKGLWIGLCNPCNNMKDVWADMRIGATAQYDPLDERLSWLWKGKRHNTEAYANSSLLKSIYKVAYATDGLGNDVEWPLCLAFGAFAVCALLKNQSTKYICATAERIGVAVGFDDGDMLKLGELTSTGFEVSSPTNL